MLARALRLAGLLAAVLAASSAPLPAASTGVVEATLDNGLRVLLLEDHRTPIVSLQVWYRVGSRDETVGRTGVSHYLEHLMFRGTARHSARAYARLVEGQGGRDNAYTTRDATVYWVDVAADRLDLPLELEADRMRNLRLDPPDVVAERSIVMEERRTRTEDDPVGALAEEFNAVAFLAHPYRLPPIGFMTDIERLTAEDLRAWYDTYYHPNNAILVAVGAFRAPELLQKVTRLFGPIPRGPAPPAVRAVEPEQRGERRVWVRRPAQLPVVFAGYQTPTGPSPDAYALEMLSVLLSEGRTSRLHRRLVQEERLALSAGGEYSSLSLDPEPFTFYATLLPERRVEDVERVLDEEVARLRDELVGEEELTRARNQIEAAFLFGQDSVHARAGALGRHELAGGWRRLDQFLPGIRAVTREDLQRVSRRYLVRDRRTTAVLLPVAPGPAEAGSR